VAVSTWTEQDTARAIGFWAEYKRQHDVSARIGKAVGIDPVTGRVWFGESALDVVNRMKGEGIDRPLYFLRVGYDYYLRKGGHR
jgi:hypothetical protein